MPRTKKATGVPYTPKPLELTPEELELIKQMRDGKVALAPVQAAPATAPTAGASDIAAAIVHAIEASRPFPQKKNSITRKRSMFYEPKDGSKKEKFKRRFFQHGLEIGWETTLPEDVKLLNQLKPVRYLGGYVSVKKRKDGGLDLDYPIKTPAQRMTLASKYGITSFGGFIQRILDERADPKKYAPPGTEDDE